MGKLHGICMLLCKIMHVSMYSVHLVLTFPPYGIWSIEVHIIIQ